MLAGVVTNLRGASKFYVKDSKGNIKELKVGDEVSQNSTISTDTKYSNSQIVVELNNETLIVLNSNQEQLIDTSLNAKNFTNEELAFNRQSVDNLTSNDKDLTAIETATGEDPTAMQTDAGDETEARSEKVVASFDTRDGNSVNMESDLRDLLLNHDINPIEYVQLDDELLNPLVDPINNQTPTEPTPSKPVIPVPEPVDPVIPIPPKPTPDPEPTKPEPDPIDPIPDPVDPVIPVVPTPIDEVASTPTLSTTIKDLGDNDTTLMEALDNLSLTGFVDTPYIANIPSLTSQTPTAIPTSPLGDADDKVVITSDVLHHIDIDLGDGNNFIGIVNNVDSTSKIITGSGNDEIIVLQSVSGEYVNNPGDSTQGNVAGVINVGDGDNTITIHTLGFGGSIIAGSGNDTVNLFSNTTASISYSGGNNIQRDDATNFGTMDLGDGNNTVNINHGFFQGAKIITGSGDDKVIINRTLGESDWATSTPNRGNAILDLGDGNNFIRVGKIDKYAQIITGSGDDIVNITNATGGDINLGDGNDQVNITTASNNMNINVGNGENSVNIGYSDEQIAALKENFEDLKEMYESMGMGSALTDLGITDVYSYIDYTTGNLFANITGGEDKDTVIINQSVTNSNINLGEGDNALSLKNNITSYYIIVGSGDDTVIIGNDVSSSSLIDLGDGENTLSIGNSLTDSTIIGGANQDTIIIGGDVSNSAITNLGYGADIVSIKGSTKGDTNINLDQGDDKLSVGSILNENNYINGGDGNDTLTLAGKQTDYAVSFNGETITWKEYLEAIKDQTNQLNSYTITDLRTSGIAIVENIENISFTDNPYSYELSIKAGLTDADGSETLSNITLKNVPLNSKLFDINQNEILANEDGTYTVAIDENGKAKITIENYDELSQNDLESITSSVTSTENSNQNSSTTEVNATVESETSILAMSENIPKNIFANNEIDFGNLSENMIQDGVVDLKNETTDNLMITLEDIINLGNKDIKILGDAVDKIEFKDTVNSDGSENKWSAVCEINQGTSTCIYTNSGDDSLQIKVEQPISDGVTS